MRPSGKSSATDRRCRSGTAGSLLRERSRREFVCASGLTLATVAFTGCLGDADTESVPDGFLTDPAAATGEVVIYWFWGDGCPVCANQHAILEDLIADDRVDVVAFEVYHDEENQALFADFIEAYSVPQEGVPTTFIGEEFWLGYTEDKDEELRDAVEHCLEQECVDAYAYVTGE